MEVDKHKILADNAFKKAVEIYESNDESMYRDMLHFAHVARLHYEYSCMDKKDIDFLTRIKKADDFIIKVYSKLGFISAAEFIDNNRFPGTRELDVE